ncbi:MAG: DUF3131 domain-containing protein [Candidatus Omnitrophica bacterium]|nr:DUF3131 domain-containing protein [Candidatus Omnitrophota bacterium]
MILIASLAGPPGLANSQALPPAHFSPDQILTVDSFSKEGQNCFGHVSKVHSPSAGRISAKINKRDSAHASGQSLEISFWLFGTQEMAWESGLAPLDISRADYLLFWLKASTGVQNRLWVSLEDKHGLSKEIRLAPYSTRAAKNQRGWKLILVPMNAFGNLDLHHLESLRLIVRSGIFGLLGKVFLDEVGFAGPRNVFFESLKDNFSGFPKSIPSDKYSGLLAMNDTSMLREIARDTWKYFDNIVDTKTHLIADHIKLNDPPFVGDYTSPTNIGLYLIASIGAYHLGFISRQDAVGRISNTLDTLARLKQYRHFFFNYYNTTHLEPTSTLISSVDNAWLAAGLIAARSAFKKELYEKVSKFLNRMDFDFFYDPGVGQMSIGYDVTKKNLLDFHYSLLCTEARILSMIAIGKHDVPRDHWFQIFRTPPSGWKWQSQKPREKEKKFQVYEVRTGFYIYEKRRFVPSWGGSLFEFLMPTLVIPEKSWSPEALGLNDQIVSGLHRDYALTERGYPVWGISPCSFARGKSAVYGEFGVKALGVKGYSDAGIVTPHAAFLALETIPQDALANIRAYLKHYDIYGEYGFYDSVHVKSKVVTRQYLALDQAMSFIALVNYLNHGSIQQLFATDDIGKEVRELLKSEDFF